MIAMATIRLKLTRIAAMLTVARRAVPRSCATATWRQAGPSGRSREKTAAARLGTRKTPPSNRQAIET